MISLRANKPKSVKAGQEDLAFEIEFFEGIVRRDRAHIEALQILGDAYTKTGQWEKGLKVDERLAKLCPTSALVFYNLACSYALLHRPDPAFAALERAIKLGYADAKWMQHDPDLANLRSDPRYTKLHRQLA